MLRQHEKLNETSVVQVT